MTLAYDGTDFAGWQVQPDRPTVQGLVREACRRILGEPVKVTGASRTDAGVHALRQVASLATASALEVGQLARGLNALLPAAVRVLDAREAPPGFDARRSALGKRYLYVMDRGRVAHPILRRFAWHPRFPLDVAAMRSALGAVRGKHDFQAFCAAPGRGRTPTCTVRSARLIARGEQLAVLLSADSFLHHMVRNIVGSLVEVGRGAQPPSWMSALLAGRDRTRSGPTAPPQGLFLVRVLYADPGDR
ncbi:MAG TPA: tRNA pseudouridine(38-40) synthase TruA [Candidatus Bathyarchaeia archaeon]|nr:tRNA pseudouridine(38-40) synthase TruA [Candidatus Bathyarchaeia archaeon]